MWRGRGARITPDASKSDQDRFLLQPHTPDFFDTVLNLIFQSEDFGGGGSAAIHNGKSMFARNAGATEIVSPRKTGVLDQPGGRYLPILFESRVTWNGQTFLGCAPFEIVVLLL